MNQIQIIKIIIFLLGISTFFINVLQTVNVWLFNKPLFVHVYFKTKSLPRKEKKFLVDNVQFYKDLDDKRKLYFEHRLALFLRKYDFIGRNDFKVTPEVRVLIASSYVKLTFGMQKYLTDVFDKIIIYPQVFLSISTNEYHKGEYNPFVKAIVFSWEDFLLGELIINDNLNLGIHEFTHALTFHGKKSKDYSATIFYNAFKEFVLFTDTPKNKSRIKNSGYFREYAFGNKLELLSVVMEHFFETPKELKKQYPELFNKIVKMLNYRSLLN